MYDISAKAEKLIQGIDFEKQDRKVVTKKIPGVFNGMEVMLVIEFHQAINRFHIGYKQILDALVELDFEKFKLTKRYVSGSTTNKHYLRLNYTVELDESKWPRTDLSEPDKPLDLKKFEEKTVKKKKEV